MAGKSASLAGRCMSTAVGWLSRCRCCLGTIQDRMGIKILQRSALNIQPFVSSQEDFALAC